MERLIVDRQTTLEEFDTRTEDIYALWHKYNMKQSVIVELYDKGILTTRP